MIYAIGDIHGQFDLLKELYTKCLRHAVISAEETGEDEHTFVFLGDYVDRGKQNRQVLDFLMNLENSPGITHVKLRGNHEQIFTEAMENPRSMFHVRMWLQNGGMSWLNEAGMDFDYFVNSYPWNHIVNWMKVWLDPYYETEDYIFVHGGLDIREPNMKKQDADSMMWARHEQKDWYRTFPKMVIHGHTPHADPVVDINRINVDTSWAHQKHDYRCLTAVALPNRRYHSHLEPEFITATKPLPLGENEK